MKTSLKGPSYSIKGEITFLRAAKNFLTTLFVYSWQKWNQEWMYK